MQTTAINNNLIFNTNHGVLNSSSKNPVKRNNTAEDNTANLRSEYESTITKSLRFQESDDRIVEQTKKAIAQNQLETLDNIIMAAQSMLNFGI